jgi:hypothetical protein
MPKRNLSLKELRRLLQTVLRKHRLMVFLPHAHMRNPTWDEVRGHATEAYAAAIKDVLNALAGDTSGLDAAMSDRGRIVVNEEHVELLSDAIERLHRSKAEEQED